MNVAKFPMGLLDMHLFDKFQLNPVKNNNLVSFRLHIQEITNSQHQWK